MAKHISGPSQLSEVEACFGKKSVREKFPSKKQFLTSMANALSNADDASSIASDTGAVFLNNNT